MSLSNTKILTSGCGITFSRQKVKTWVNILQLSGCDVTDVSGPAVSNQWIINKAFVKLVTDPTIKTVILQLTSLEKLDVEVDQERITELVRPDAIRNFVIDHDYEVKSHDQIESSGVWPSSRSIDHQSKLHWYKWLCSPGLEREDLYCKLLLLNFFCQQQNIALHVYQGYDVPWDTKQYQDLQRIIKNIDASFYTVYEKSQHYQDLGLQDSTVPTLAFQIEIAHIVSQHLPTTVQHKVAKYKLMYEKNH